MKKSALQRSWNTTPWRATDFVRCIFSLSPPWLDSPKWGRASLLSSLQDHTQDTSHTVVLLWTSDRPDAETSTSQYLQTNIHALGGIRTHNPSKRTTVDPRLRLPGHRDRRYIVLLSLCNNLFRLRAGNRGIVVPFPGEARKLLLSKTSRPSLPFIAYRGGIFPGVKTQWR